MPATRFVYVDECKEGPYWLAATVVDAARVATIKPILTKLLLPRQERLHFNHEKDERRRQHLKVMASLPLEVWPYQASRTSGRQAEKRAACLTALTGDLQATACDVRLYVESDDSIVRNDRSLLYELRKKWPLDQDLSYCHVRPKDEPGLWVSDGVAWSWRRGGEWQRVIKPLVRHIIV